MRVCACVRVHATTEPVRTPPIEPRHSVCVCVCFFLCVYGALCAVRALVCQIVCNRAWRWHKVSSAVQPSTSSLRVLQPCQYRLAGTVTHLGQTLHRGHYVNRGFLGNHLCQLAVLAALNNFVTSRHESVRGQRLEDHYYPSI